MSYGHTSPREGLDLNPEGALLPGCVFCTVYITKAKLGSHAVSRGWSCWALGCPLPHLPQMLSPPHPGYTAYRSRGGQSWLALTAAQRVWLVGFPLAHQR